LHWIAEVLQTSKHHIRLIIRVKSFWQGLPFSHNTLLTKRRTHRRKGQMLTYGFIGVGQKTNTG